MVLFLFKYSDLWDIFDRFTEAVKSKTHRRNKRDFTVLTEQ